MDYFRWTLENEEVSSCKLLINHCVKLISALKFKRLGYSVSLSIGLARLRLAKKEWNSIGGFDADFASFIYHGASKVWED
ncbi:hypothetical protein, partial [Streptococcus sp. S784/96/1]|uniref:hypothetical protein n=1 Tax=Streptococcus sp. S784/96/1 TaxID=2653499 RepID=UPI001E3C907D